MNGNQQQQQERNKRRKIIFKGQLQQRETRKSGFLLWRKEQPIYSNEKWVLLCVHEGGNGGGIPHLEWYENLEKACDHDPERLQDLLYCKYVVINEQLREQKLTIDRKMKYFKNVVVGEERCLVIGFVDEKRPPLELSAPTVEERKQWVRTLTETLQQLNCLNTSSGDGHGPGATMDEEDDAIAMCYPRAENEYVALNPHSNDDNGEAEEGEAIGSFQMPFGLRSAETAATSSTPSANVVEAPLSTTLMPVHCQSFPYVPMRTSSRQQQQQSTDKASKMKLFLTDTIPMQRTQRQQDITREQPEVKPRLLSNAASTPNSGGNSHNNVMSGFVYNTMPRQQKPAMCVGSTEQQPNTSSANLFISTTNVLRQPNSNAVVMEENKDANGGDSSDGSAIVPPPLPPRRAQQLDTPTAATMPRLPSSPIPSSPPQPSTLGATAHCSDAAEYNAIGQQQTALSQYDRLNPTGSQQYQQLSRLSGDFLDLAPSPYLRLSSSSSSGATNSTSNASATNRSSVSHPEAPSPRGSAQYDLLPTATVPHVHQNHPRPHISNYAEQIFHETITRPRTVYLSLTLLVEHVAFVDNGGKIVWIAGWSPLVDQSLRNILHFGDQVVEMAGIPLLNVIQLPDIYANAEPGVQIPLLLRANDSARVYTLTRPENPRKELGIVLHKRENKISSIEPGSAAYQAQIPARLPPYFLLDRRKTTKNDVSAVITELDGVPLSLYRNDQFYRRLDKLPVGTPINLTLHPKDFCALVARNLKSQNLKCKRFVRDS